MIDKRISYMSKIVGIILSGAVAAYFFGPTVLAWYGESGGGTPIERIAQAKKAETFFDGKTIEIMVPFAQAGEMGEWAHKLERHLRPTLSAKTKLAFKFVPGDGGIKGSNEYVTNRKPDGTYLLVTSGSVVLPWVLGQDGVKYDLRKMTPIVAETISAAFFTTPATGTDVAKWQASPKALMSSKSSVARGNIAKSLALNILGLPVKYVAGNNDASLKSLLSGESNIAMISSGLYGDHVKKEVLAGRVLRAFALDAVSVSGEFERAQAFSDLPTPSELSKANNKGVEPSGPNWDAYKAVIAAEWTARRIIWVHGKAPNTAKIRLRTIFATVLNSSEAIADFGDQQAVSPFLFARAAIQKIVFETTKMDSSTKDWLKTFLRNQREAKI